jgi:phosphonoacetaldehyde hydrolase
MARRFPPILTVFDWAGTLVDRGSSLPIKAMKDAFTYHGYEVSERAIREFMGMSKKEHINSVIQVNFPNDKELTTDQIYGTYRVYESGLLGMNPKYSELIPGAKDTIKRIRDMGHIVGTTTGYDATIAARISKLAAMQGLFIDMERNNDFGSRGSGLQIMSMLRHISIDPVSIVKVGDTKLDMMEGRAVQAVTVFCSESGNGDDPDARKLADYVIRDVSEFGRLFEDRIIPSFERKHLARAFFLG